jgi:hypothetical protein
MVLDTAMAITERRLWWLWRGLWRRRYRNRFRLLIKFVQRNRSQLKINFKFLPPKTFILCSGSVTINFTFLIKKQNKVRNVLNRRVNKNPRLISNAPRVPDQLQIFNSGLKMWIHNDTGKLRLFNRSCTSASSKWDTYSGNGSGKPSDRA